MAEEAAAIAFSATSRTRLMADDDAFGLLDHGSDSLAETIRDSEIERGIAALPSLATELNSYAAERAEALADDHKSGWDREPRCMSTRSRPSMSSGSTS